MPTAVAAATLQIPHVSIFPHEKSEAPVTNGYQHDVSPVLITFWLITGLLTMLITFFTGLEFNYM